MRVEQMEQRFDNLKGRVDRIEQILPTLATKDDLRAAIEPLATQAEVIAAIAASEQRMRTHFDVVTESLRDDIKLIAAAFESLAQRVS
jgi:hypothetical protein